MTVHDDEASAKARVVSSDIDLPTIDIISCFKQVALSGIKGPLQQIVDIFRLRFLPCRIATSEYYYYRLYDPSLSFEDCRRFIGWRRESAIKSLLTVSGWQSTVQDKVLFNTICRGLGLPVARQLALYHPCQSSVGVEGLHTPAALRAFLLERANYPMFGKLWRSDRSRGVADLESCDPATEELRLGNGTTISVDEFVEQVVATGQLGYLLEERLQPHASMRSVSGSTLATVRVIVLLRRGVPEVHRTVWKIPVGASMADNFWRGNLLAGIDKATGRVYSVIRGVGPNSVEVDKHPDTGHTLQGMFFPQWSALIDLCLRAAPAFWGIKMQAFDVALTEKGPVIVEMNICGDVNLPQLSSGQGLLDAQFESFLNEETLPAAQRDLTLR